ncbi:hypothetical protein HAX54_013171 [Datura stramonium]|uniref:Uncharacterized protein n=1 Tax=Datura stramonium TaxID=4076 RepID=A0ABS8TNP7_DATST|nr:hypothetical protein [Datura stramonium]
MRYCSLIWIFVEKIDIVTITVRPLLNRGMISIKHSMGINRTIRDKKGVKHKHFTSSLWYFFGDYLTAEAYNSEVEADEPNVNHRDAEKLIFCCTGTLTAMKDGQATSRVKIVCVMSLLSSELN